MKKQTDNNVLQWVDQSLDIIPVVPQFFEKLRTTVLQIEDNLYNLLTN